MVFMSSGSQILNFSAGLRIISLIPANLSAEQHLVSTYRHIFQCSKACKHGLLAQTLHQLKWNLLRKKHRSLKGLWQAAKIYPRLELNNAEMSCLICQMHSSAAFTSRWY